MIVCDLDIQRVATGPGEADPPLFIDANAVVAFAVAVKQLELIGRWDRQILQVVRSVQLLQLHTWREDFARLMTEQGIAANAVPRVIRGRNTAQTRDALYRTLQPGASNVVRERVTDIATLLMLTDSSHNPARVKLLELMVLSELNVPPIEESAVEAVDGAPAMSCSGPILVASLPVDINCCF